MVICLNDDDVGFLFWFFFFASEASHRKENETTKDLYGNRFKMKQWENSKYKYSQKW